MIRTLSWKEYREHRLIWLTMAVVNSGFLVGLASLADSDFRSHSEKLEMLGAVAVLLVWVYGMIGGGMLLAGERESATLEFLDALPVTRLRLWMVKGQIGLLLLAGQVLLLSCVLAALGAAEYYHLLVMAVSGVVGMAFGLFFSARGESVLNVIGLAIIGQIAAGIAAALIAFGISFAWVFAFWLIERPPRDEFKGAYDILLVLVNGGLTLAAVVGSARIFSRPDRLRRYALSESVPQRVSVVASWGRLVWLSFMQMRPLMRGLTIFSLALGLALWAAGPILWPLLTLLIGVLCGVTVYGDEQMHGSSRFLGDQRLPLGRVWIVKTGMRLALAVFAAFLLMLPSLAVAIYHRMEDSNPPSVERVPFFDKVLHSCLVGTVVPTGLHLTMWLLYGFSVGHLCGLLFRKSLVAGVVALGWSALLVSLWIPSLLGIGLHFWQVAGAPVILLAIAWILMPAWVADRLLARATFVQLGVALTAAGLWTVGGLWYRVVEVPDVPDQFGMPAFVASIPPLEENEAGLAIRKAWTHADKLMKDFGSKKSHKPLFPKAPKDNAAPGDGFPGQQDDTAFYAQKDQVLQRGWPAGESELGDWLDEQFENDDTAECLDLLMTAADRPLGWIESPKLLTFSSPPSRIDHNATLFNQILAIRGLQRQACGDSKTFVDHLRIGLAMSRNMQHLAPTLPTHIGRGVERVWLSALERWLEDLPDHSGSASEQLRRASAILRRHEAELPDESESIKAEFLIAMNTLEQVPDQLLAMAVLNRPKNDDGLHQVELRVAALMWRFPWEHQRHQRILRVMFQGDERERRAAREWGGVLSQFGFRADIVRRRIREVAQMRAGQLQAALRSYQAKSGELPATLDALVPHYLPTIPADPFDGKPFRYRLSRGEKIGWIDEAGTPGTMPAGAAAGAPGLPPMPGLPPPPTRFVPAGQGILWSVGEDRIDDGGVQQSRTPSNTAFGEDIIYLVPPPRE
jgi:hypothetical protein